MAIKDLKKEIEEAVKKYPPAEVNRKYEADVLSKKNPELSLFYVKTVKKANISAHEQVIIDSKNLEYITELAKVQGANVKKLEDEIIKSENAHWCFVFAYEVKNADVGRLMRKVIDSKDPEANIDCIGKFYGTDPILHLLAALASGQASAEYIYKRIGKNLNKYLVSIATYNKNSNIADTDNEKAKLLYQSLYSENINEILRKVIDYVNYVEYEEKEQNNKSLFVTLYIIAFIVLTILNFGSCAKNPNEPMSLVDELWMCSIPAFFIIGGIEFKIAEDFYNAMGDSKTKKQTSGINDSIELLKKELSKKYGFNYLTEERVKELRRNGANLSEELFKVIPGQQEVSQEVSEERPKQSITVTPTTKKEMNKDRVKISENELFITKDGIKMINPKYLDILFMIDLSDVNFESVYVSGVNFTGCNPSNLNPQTVYGRDLSNTTFVEDPEDDENAFPFNSNKNLNGVNLCGAKIESKKVINLVFYDAKTDDRTEIIEAGVEKTIRLTFGGQY